MPMASKALFLDRDGVVNFDYGYVYKIENFHFMDGIFDLVREANKLCYKVVIITNQAGIARGYYSEDDFFELTRWMLERFAEANALISKVYFSPYHPIFGLGEYLRDDFSRKPHPGMILQAQRDLSLDLNQSVLVGDKTSDISAGNAAGVGINLLLAAKHSSELRDINYNLIGNLKDVSKYLERDFL